MTLTLMYWAVLRIWFDKWYHNYYSIWLHGIFFCLIAVDFFLCQIMIAPKHWWPLLILSIAYLTLNVIVSLASGPVYSILTYKDFASYIYVVATLILMFGSFFCFYGFSRCKAKHFSTPIG